MLWYHTCYPNVSVFQSEVKWFLYCTAYAGLLLYRVNNTVVKGKTFWGCEPQVWSYSECQRASMGAVPFIWTAPAISFDDSSSAYNHRYRVEGCALKIIISSYFIKTQYFDKYNIWNNTWDFKKLHLFLALIHYRFKKNISNCNWY